MADKQWPPIRATASYCTGGISRGYIFLITGVMTRITGSIFSIILFGVIFKIKGLDKFAGGQFTGWKFDLVMLAACLMIIITGPGKASISHLVKRIPRYLQ
ncbi:MAG: hypothetical protein AB1299_06770 [Thermoproteota archaeon]